jgi:hypothetical protein
MEMIDLLKQKPGYLIALHVSMLILAALIATAATKTDRAQSDGVDAHKRNSMALSLKELLLRDWGTDLPIRGGYGQSRDAPIVVTSSDAKDVARTQMMTLRGIGRGRGVFWRKLDRRLLGPEWPGIEQFKIETVTIHADQLVTQVENYYFETSAATDANRASQDPTVVSHSDATGLLFPYEIDWLHFDGLTDNETHAPGLGVSLAYGAPGVKATIYVYNHGRQDIPNSMTDPWLQAEFENAANDIRVINTDIRAWPDPPNNGAYRVRYYSVGEDARDATVLWMTVARGKIIKARLTWTRDHFIDKVVSDFLRTLLAVVGKSQ